MADLFFYGTLCHAPLLACVLGRAPDTAPAVLPGHSVWWAKGEAFPLIAEGGAGARGVLVRGLTGDDLARLDFYEGGFGYRTRDMAVRVAGGAEAMALVFFPDAGLWQPGAPWSLDDWAGRWGATVIEAAGDFMAQFGCADPVRLRRRYPQMLTRAGARLRAQTARAGAAELRRSPAPDDVEVEALHHPYSAYFAVEERDLRFRRFDGTMSAPVNRAVFVSGDAAVLLPYDPVRDRVLVIEQFRAGPQARGDANPWLIEAVAGRIDGGETPEEAARREAAEEAGLQLAALIPGPSYYPSPAAKAEYLYSFIGIADLPDGVAGTGGLAAEAEDIRSHVISFERLMRLAASGEIDNAPLLILAQWLSAERPRLRAARGA
ncbi:MAG: NUDIX domain-containing protein [Proteobacteria bacterium]|nr:NUDIX domain-containing protein [Pseudomonadota bacterium]MBS0573709.1 NUDIX domain-containing protein [Pseudomonadota bacterium]